MWSVHVATEFGYSVGAKSASVLDKIIVKRKHWKIYTSKENHFVNTTTFDVVLFVYANIYGASKQ